MSYAVPNSFLAGIVAKWAATTPLQSIPLRYGRVDEGTAYPYAAYFIVSDTPADAFNASKVIDAFEVEFGVWDVNSDNVAALLDAVRVAYHRSSIPLAAGQVLSSLRIHSGLLIEPTEGPQSSNVYHGFIQFRVNVDG